MDYFDGAPGSSGTSGSTMSLPVGTAVASLSDWQASHSTYVHKLVFSNGNGVWQSVPTPTGDDGEYTLRGTKNGSYFSLYWINN